MFARAAAVYDMHFAPLRAVFLHQGSWEGHRLRPTAHNVSVNYLDALVTHVFFMAWACMV